MSTPAPTCPCGCAVAAWSLPWPVATAPWSPAVVHDSTPRPRSYTVAEAYPAALFPPAAVDPDLVDTTTVHPADALRSAA